MLIVLLAVNTRQRGPLVFRSGSRREILGRTVPQENVEIVPLCIRRLHLHPRRHRRWVAALRREHPRHPAQGVAWRFAAPARTQRGAEAFRIWPEQWDDFQIEILRTADLGDDVLVTTRTRRRGKQSGVEVEMRISFVFTVRNQKIVEMRSSRVRVRPPKPPGCGSSSACGPFPGGRLARHRRTPEPGRPNVCDGLEPRAPRLQLYLLPLRLSALRLLALDTRRLQAETHPRMRLIGEPEPGGSL
jgi:hypothetical protein